MSDDRYSAPPDYSGRPVNPVQPLSHADKIQMLREGRYVEIDGYIYTSTVDLDGRIILTPHEEPINANPRIYLTGFGEKSE